MPSKATSDMTDDIKLPSATGSGRVHRQQRGEQRRTAILRATWQVVLRDGVRGVRHRAVAEAAGVPLAATTYYFKDIQELLVQSFQLFAEESLMQFTQPFWAEAEHHLAALGSAAPREDVAGVLLDRAAEFIALRLRDHREQVIMEYAFWYAALHNVELQAAVRGMAQRWMALLMPWLEQAQVDQPEQAARCLLATVRRIEYEALIEGTATHKPGWIREALAYQIKGLW